jgi:hypothetical protein
MLALVLLPLAAQAWAAPSGNAAQARIPVRKGSAAPALRITALQIGPASPVLDGPDASQMLLVTGRLPDGRLTDLSLQAKYSVSDPKIARVSPAGVVTPVNDGQVKVVAAFAGQRAVGTAEIRNAHVARPVSFQNQVVPLLTKAGCNAGGCHGKSTGQNGFRLSLLGYDPGFDYDAIVKEGRGRRVFSAAPAQSLLLTKPTGEVPHGGGIRFKKDAPEYRMILRWLEAGTPVGDPEKDPRVVSISVEPGERVLRRKGSRQRLIVTAVYTDGSRRDVTREAQFVSNDAQVAAAGQDGAVTTGENTGDAAIMVRYMGQVAAARVTVPMEDKIARFPDFPPANFIDERVYAKLKKLNVVPSDLCADNEFLRRASLDAIGTLPTAEEVRAFLADAAPDKRAKLVDRLLDRPEYGDVWAQRWSDVFRNQVPFGERKVGSWTFHYWIRQAVNANMPYDQFVGALLTAQGDGSSNPPANWYRDANLVNDTAQLFLGMRIDCANCHHHPYEKWSQDDYYGFSAFFARVARKDLGFGLSGIYVNADGSTRHPVTGKLMKPKALDGPEYEVGEFDDPRQKLVEWLTAPENPFFARAEMNRLWKFYLGRGLVEPVDDMRLTNPPSNPELLDALAKEFVQSKYDVKHMVRLIMTSRTYQLSAATRGNNVKDTQNYSRAYARRMSAEVLLDALNQVTGSPDKFSGLPVGTRAIQLPDETVPSFFLDVFGRPKRETACTCERSYEGNLSQTMHIMNSPEIDNKVRDGNGRAAALAASKKPDSEVVEELYLCTFARPPKKEELAAALEYLAAKQQKDPKEQKAPDRRAAVEDLLWALVNTNEFLFNH